MPDKLSRIFELLTFLQSGPPRTARQLADQLGLSERTIFRYVKRLKSSGLPITHGGVTPGYRLLGGPLLPATQFTLQEALSLLILCEHLGDQNRGLPFQQAAQTAARKVISSLPVRIIDQVSELTGSIFVRLEPHSQKEETESVYHTLTNAILDRQRVRIQYDSFTEGKILSTRLNPYRLVFVRRSWYVVGRSTLHREVRTFNLNRIQKVEPLEETYVIPKTFHLDRYFGNAWQMIREPGVSHEVCVRFAPMVARNVAEVVWHKTQELEWNTDGSLNFSVTVDSLQEIVWWILGYGNQAEVLEPPELREQVHQHARDLVKVYGADDEVASGSQKM